MDNSDIEDLIQVDDEMIIEFVKVTPYPNYEKMLEKLKKDITLWSEYGEQQHICCKIIYENPINKNMHRKIDLLSDTIWYGCFV